MRVAQKRVLTTIQIGYGQKIQHGQNVSETEKKAYSTCTFSVQKKLFRGGGSEGHSAGARMTLRATARRRAICSVSSAGNIGNRPHQCNVPAPTAVPNHPTAFSSVGWPFSGHALHRNRTARPCARCERHPTDFGEVPRPPANFAAPNHSCIFIL